MTKEITLDESKYISILKSLKPMEFKRLIKENQIDILSAIKADGSLLTLKKYKHFLKDESFLINVMKYNTYPIMVLAQNNYPISKLIIDSIDTCQNIHIGHIPLSYQSEELHFKSIKMNPNNIWHIKDPSERIIKYILENHPNYISVIIQNASNKVLNKEFQLILLEQFRKKTFSPSYIFSYLFEPIDEWQEEIVSSFSSLPTYYNFCHIPTFKPNYFKKIITENLVKYEHAINLAKTTSITSENLDILYDFILKSSFLLKQEVLKIIENHPNFNIARLTLMHIDNT